MLRLLGGVGLGGVTVAAGQPRRTTEGKEDRVWSPMRGRDGLHCNPPRGALQSISGRIRRNPVPGLDLFPCSRALQRIRRPTADPA